MVQSASWEVQLRWASCCGWELEGSVVFWRGFFPPDLERVLRSLSGGSAQVCQGWESACWGCLEASSLCQGVGFIVTRNPCMAWDPANCCGTVCGSEVLELDEDVL